LPSFVTTIVPSIGLLAVFTTAVAAAAELFVLVVVFFDELELLDPPQAASVIAAAAPRATTAETPSRGSGGFADRSRRSRSLRRRPSSRERRATPVPALAVPWCMPVLSLCLLT
jgi:hypothetical protein